MNNPFWYKSPDAMSSKGWVIWRNKIKRQYPVQYFLREFCTDSAYWIKRNWDNIYWTVYSWFKPAHPMIRKAIPRRWSDLTETMVNVNLAAILQFKEEADGSIVNWDSDEEHRNFKKWLEDAAYYVLYGRKRLEQQLAAAYPKDHSFENPSPLSYEELYGEVNRLEKELWEKDTQIIKEMIDRRDYFWT